MWWLLACRPMDAAPPPLPTPPSDPVVVPSVPHPTGDTGVVPPISDTGDPTPLPFDATAWIASASRGTTSSTTQPFDQLRADIPLGALGGVSQGRELFVAPWQASTEIPTLLDGLGPLYNASSCVACHPAAGRPATYDSLGNVGAGLLVRTHRTDTGGPDPLYGDQLQPLGVAGVPGEAALHATTVDSPWTWADGTVVPRQRIELSVTPAYGPLHPSTQLAPRLSPQLIGLGLLEHVPDSALLAMADPDDADADGISGRLPVLASSLYGRFGWRSTQATTRSQSAAAFAGDLGISSPVDPEPHCTDAQSACLQAAAVGTDISDAGLDQVTAYLQALAIPTRRLPDTGDPRRAIALFQSVGCASCHTPTLQTAATAPVHLASVVFHPYTDLLLHDMGPDLAEPVGAGDAGPREWRTAPLWGLGRVAASPQARFLHDGRARTLEEAIAWHGGEASASRTAFGQLSAADRSAVLELLSLL